MTEEKKELLVEFVVAKQNANNKIREHALREQDLIYELMDLNEKINAVEMRVLDSISRDNFADGKPKYRNETERDIEKLKRLSADIGYRDLKERKHKAGKELGTTKIEKEYLERQLTIWNSLVHF